jgi:2,3-bisphosphoglycerate-dependent phosphoglycerate mutase
MKIYILRHEDRTMDASFFAPLTKEGLDNSVKLIKLLKEHKIDKIFSSPFIRTLQTIHPYAKSINEPICIDYSLSEIQHPEIIPKKSFQISLPLYISESFNCNPKYTSIFNPMDHIYPENEKIVEKRVKKFITKLVNEYLKSRANIVIVSHQIVCNIILQIVNRYNKNINLDVTYNYPKGGLTQVFNKDHWIFDPINWDYNVSDD